MNFLEIVDRVGIGTTNSWLNIENIKFYSYWPYINVSSSMCQWFVGKICVQENS